MVIIKRYNPRATTEHDIIIGHNIKTFRILSGIRSSVIAKRLNIKAAQYYKLESGKNHVTLSRACDLADMFKVTIQDFINKNQQFTIEDLKVIRSLILNFLKIDNMQHRKDVWNLILKYLDGNKEQVIDYNDTKALSHSFLKIESQTHRTQIMNFTYAVIKIK